MKNEAEAYMLKELSLLKWQEKATKCAAEDNSAKMCELQKKLSSLEENLKSKRFSWSYVISTCFLKHQYVTKIIAMFVSEKRSREIKLL